MTRKIVDYQKLTEDILALLVTKYPDGYDDDDIITFRNAKNEVVEAVEVRTEEFVYLVKVGKRLVQAMEDFNDDEKDNDTNDNTDDAFPKSFDEDNADDYDLE